MQARPDSLALLAQESDLWLRASPPTIVEKKFLAPSGDPHDYISIAPYCWPDPLNPDGPWVHDDGKVNPIFYDYDNPIFEAFCQGTIRLILRFVATESLDHARQAGRFLRTWCVDAATLMRPHLQYAQFIPGVSEGRAFGIIDTTSLLFVLDAVALVPFSEDWTVADLAGVKNWVSRYLDWLLDSDFGKEENSQPNNHGSWYDAQVAGFAVFCGRPDVAHRQIETATIPRLECHFDADGSQPHELARTLSLTYCTYNLLAFACVARIGERFGIDLWATEHGALSRGLQYMLPYYGGKILWTHQQLKPFTRGSAALLLNLASGRVGESSLQDALAEVEEHPWQSVTFSKAELTGRKSPSPRS
jgi:hypothetical protein